MAKRDFDVWMAKVDRELIKYSGMDSGMMDDYSYYDCFEAGDTPEQTAREALENACGSMGYEYEDVFPELQDDPGVRCSHEDYPCCGCDS